MGNLTKAESDLNKGDEFHCMMGKIYFDKYHDQVFFIFSSTCRPAIIISSSLELKQILQIAIFISENL